MKIRSGFVSNSSTSSFAIIGIPVSGKKLTISSVKRNCKCKVTFDKKKPPEYCPKCGQKFNYEDKTFIKEVTGDEGEEKLFRKYSLIFPDSDSCGENQKEIFITLKMAHSSEYDQTVKQQLPTAEAIEEFKNKLGSLGLWDEEKFRLWSVFYSAC